MTRSVLLVKLQPNQDLTQALEAIVKDHGFDQAQILAAVGSLVEAVFDVEGAAVRVPGPGHEIAALTGKIDPAGGSRLSGYVCCTDASVKSGVFVYGLNAVGVTFEILLEGRKT